MNPADPIYTEIPPEMLVLIVLAIVWTLSMNWYESRKDRKK